MREIEVHIHLSSKVIQKHSCVLNDAQVVFNTHSTVLTCSQSSSGDVHTHQNTFMHTQLSSRDVHTHSNIHMHSNAFKKCSKLLTLTQRHYVHSITFEGVFSPFTCLLCEVKNNHSMKAFGNLLNFLRKLPCGVKSTFPTISHLA